MEKGHTTMARKHENLKVLKPKKELPRDTTDRFSNLPECILHHILSYLERNSVPRMMCVSRSLRQACTTVPQLDLQAHIVPAGKCFCLNFQKFVSRMLMTKGNAVSRLRLHWYCGSCYEYIMRAGSFVNSWIQTAVGNNLQVLDLRFRPMEALFILPCLGSLKVLRLDLVGGSFWVHDLHPSTFPHLVSLTLSNLKIVDTSTARAFGHQFSSANLKRLCLDDITGVSHISIMSPSLEQFEIWRWRTGETSCDLELDSPSLKEVVISQCCFNCGVRMSITCPWLQDLTMSELAFRESSQTFVSAGRLEALTIDMAYFSCKYVPPSVPTIHFLEDLLFLEDAVVNLQARTPFGALVPEADYSRMLQTADPGGYTDVDTLGPWLDRMRLAIALQISIEVFRCDGLPTFHNLQHLVVICWSFRGEEDLLLSPYLISCLHLRTLTMERDRWSPAVVDDNVVHNMCLRAGKFVTKKGKAKMAVFSFKDSELRIDLEKDTARLLREAIPKCDNIALEKVMYFYSE